MLFRNVFVCITIYTRVIILNYIFCDISFSNIYSICICIHVWYFVIQCIIVLTHDTPGTTRVFLMYSIRFDSIRVSKLFEYDTNTKSKYLIRIVSNRIKRVLARAKKRWYVSEISKTDHDKIYPTTMKSTLGP